LIPGCAGYLFDKRDQWQILLEELGVSDEEARISAPEVKTRLRVNTETALEPGIFGVPCFMIDKAIFWGNDSIDFLLAYLQQPDLLK
jgi:2-hydroxychromene-2-carboxylate isomerase